MRCWPGSFAAWLVARTGPSSISPQRAQHTFCIPYRHAALNTKYELLQAATRRHTQCEQQLLQVEQEATETISNLLTGDVPLTGCGVAGTCEEFIWWEEVHGNMHCEIHLKHPVHVGAHYFGCYFQLLCALPQLGKEGMFHYEPRSDIELYDGGKSQVHVSADWK